MSRAVLIFATALALLLSFAAELPAGEEKKDAAVAGVFGNADAAPSQAFACAPWNGATGPVAAVAINGVLEQAYLLSADRLSIEIVALGTGASMGKVTLQRPADAIAVDTVANKLLVATANTREIRKLDPIRLEWDKKTLFVDRDPTLLALDAEGVRLLVGNRQMRGLAIYDTDAGIVLGAFDLPQAPLEIAAASVNADIAWAVLEGGTLVQLDLNTRKVLASVDLKRELHGLAVNGDGSLVCTCDATGSKLLVRSADKLQEIPLSFKPDTVLLDPHGKRALVLDGGKMADVNLETLSVAGTSDVPQTVARASFDPNRRVMLIPTATGVFRGDWTAKKTNDDNTIAVKDAKTPLMRKVVDTIRGHIYGFVESRYEYQDIGAIKGPTYREEVRVGGAGRLAHDVDYHGEVGGIYLDNTNNGKSINTLTYLYDQNLSLWPESSHPFEIGTRRDAEELTSDISGKENIITDNTRASLRNIWSRDLNTNLYGEILRQNDDADSGTFKHDEDRYGMHANWRASHNTDVRANFEHITLNDNHDRTGEEQRNNIDLDVISRLRDDWELRGYGTRLDSDVQHGQDTTTENARIRLADRPRLYNRTEFLSDYRGAIDGDQERRTLRTGGIWDRSWSKTFRTEVSAFHLLDEQVTPSQTLDQTFTTTTATAHALDAQWAVDRQWAQSATPIDLRRYSAVDRAKGLNEQDAYKAFFQRWDNYRVLMTARHRRAGADASIDGQTYDEFLRSWEDGRRRMEAIYKSRFGSDSPKFDEFFSSKQSFASLNRWGWDYNRRWLQATGRASSTNTTSTSGTVVAPGGTTVGNGFDGQGHGIFRWEMDDARSWLEQSQGLVTVISPETQDGERTVRAESITTGALQFTDTWSLSGGISPFITAGERGNYSGSSQGLDGNVRLEYRTRNDSYAGVESAFSTEHGMGVDTDQHFERLYADWNLFWRNLGWARDQVRAGGEINWDGTDWRKQGFGQYQIGGKPSLLSFLGLTARYDYRDPGGQSIETRLNFDYRVNRTYLGIEGRWRPIGSDYFPKEQYLMVRLRREW